jgi:hypothetical protein
MDRIQALTIMATTWVSGGQVARALQRRLPAAAMRPESLQEGLRAAERTLGGERADGMYLVGPRDQTLGDVVRYYLEEDPEASSTHQRMMLGALRMWYAMPRTYSRADLYAACARTAAADLHELPERIHARAREHGKSEAHAASFRSALRAALVVAAVRGRVGMAIPVSWIDMDSEDAGASDVTGRLIVALAALWAAGEIPTREAMHARGGCNPGSIDRRLDRWAAEGLVEWHPTHRGRELAAVNLTGRADVTGATVLTAFCARRPFSEVRHRQVLGSVRAYLGLPERWRMHEEEIVAAAEALRAGDLQGLPDAIQRAARGAGKSAKTAETWASAVRSMLRWAAEQRLVPMIWAGQRAGPWDRARNAWIPGGAGERSGVKASTRAAHRTAWQWLREAVQDLRGPEYLPGQLTAEDVQAARDWLRRRGRYDHAAAVSSALNFAGRRGYGPRAGHHPPASILLPVADTKSYDAFIEALERHLGGRWPEVFRWIGRWHTAQPSNLAIEGLPERPPARQLSEGTLHGRAKGVRWILGLLMNQEDSWVSRSTADPDVTRHVDEQDDGRTPCPSNCLCRLSPEQVFCLRATVEGRVVGLEPVIALGERLWTWRYEEGDLEAPVGSAIHGYVLAAGLIAEAIYRRIRHERGLKVAQLSAEQAAKKPRWGLDPTVEEGAAKAPIEEALWEGYQLSRRVAGRLKAEARNYGENEGPNTRKDIRRIVAQTPFGWFHTVLQAYLRLARRSLETDAESREHHELVRDAFILALFASTLIRGEEAVHLRCDVHLPPEAFDPDHEKPIRIKLRSIDRKNGSRHTVQLFPDLMPAWLRAAYLGDSRPWLVRHLPADQRHQHLLVDNAGRAFGCAGEDLDGRRRDSKKQIEKRVGALRELFKNHVGRVAWEHCGLECPTRDGDFTLHVVRNAGAAAIYATHGKTAAAQALGDSETSVTNHYGFLDGEQVTEDMMRAASAVGRLHPAPSEQGRPSSGELLAELRASMEREGLAPDLIARVLAQTVH